MRYFFFFGHPAQFHFYKNIAEALKKKGNEVRLYIKKKDVLESLIKETGWAYGNISPDGRGKSKFAIFLSLLKRDIKVFREIIRHKPDVLIASDPSFSHAGFLFRIPCLNFMDDDADATGYYPRITYPFSSSIITPETVKVGKWEHKRVSYNGYMKLAYLHPGWFIPDREKTGKCMGKSYFLIRLSGLGAHHDKGVKGINDSLLEKIIRLIPESHSIIISSERQIPEEFEKFRVLIPVNDMHHFLAHARMLISDSQSMTGEAAVLGVPSVRISSFKGKLRVLEELEREYGLTYAFYPEDEVSILRKIDEFISMEDIKDVFQEKRNKMLNDKIDVTAFSIWFIENYPESRRIMIADPGYADRFK